jgi:NAD(P) transhydrogenase
MQKYDLIVIGSGPSGEKAAVKAAYFGYKVAIIEKERKFGGAGTNTGTLPSKTLKETSLYISGKYEKGLYGIERDLTRGASVKDFLYRKDYVSDISAKEVYDNLNRHKVDIYHDVGSFEDPHTIAVDSQKIYGKNILIATGSYPYHPKDIPFDNERILDSDTILEIKRFPTSLCLVGAGVIGCEYATIFSTMGVRVFLVNKYEKILPFLDHEISEALVQQMQESGVEFLFNTSNTAVRNEGNYVKVELENGKTLEVDMFLYAAGRNGNIHSLNLEKAGVKVGERESILVDKQYRTNIPHIYAVGDVTGFPALASTGMDQGRVAVAHMFHTQDLENLPTVVPYGIYTVPEVSTVGMTEEEAQKADLHYAVGKACYSDMARGRIMGVKAGFLKFVFEKNTLQVIGVHIIGNIASELIHYGTMLIKGHKTLYDVIGEVFNYPTLHDLYKYAAYDGLSTIAGRKVK